MPFFGPLSQYLCSKCGSILKVTANEIEISTVTEDCPNCGASLASTLQRLNAKTETMPLKFTTAFDLLDSSQSELTSTCSPKGRKVVQFKSGIKAIDNFMSLGSTGAFAITGYNANLLLTRLCVRSLLPAKYGGLGSQFAIVVDAGNKSDFYQTVNFIKQHGLHLRKTLDRIIVSRTFTIYQLKTLLQKQLPQVIEKYMPGVLIVPGLLDLFEDTNIKKREAKRVIDRIMKTINEIASKLLVITTVNESKYNDLVLPSFTKQIRLASTDRNKVSLALYNEGRKANVTLTQKEMTIARDR